MAGADADEEEGPVWTAAVKETLNHNMLRPFFYQCEMCGGMGHCEGESTICRHCDGSGFVGPKGRFLPHDPHEPGAELIWVSGFTAPMHSVARKLSTGEVELHGLRIAYDNVAELAEAAMALLEEYRESEHGEIRRQTRERLKRAIDEAGR
jgi:hypothetical protein